MSKRSGPIWLRTSTYYVLAFAVAGVFFFVSWGILHESGDEMPWVTAGITASIVLAGSAILREVILRRFSVERARTDSRNSSRASTMHAGDRKLTVEINNAIIREIKQKSDAANVLSRFSAGHREVFELCDEYVARTERELKTINAGSPRLAALLRGRTTVLELHRYHLLRWAEIETRNLTNESMSRGTTTEKIEAAQSAMEVVDAALASYPSEKPLLESREVLEDMLLSIRVAELVETAERYAYDGRNADAVASYKDALFELGRRGAETPERIQAANRINLEIERLRGSSVE